MRGIRLATGILVLAAARIGTADGPAPVPAAIPPCPVAQQPAAPASPEQQLLREKLAQRDELQREIEALAQATGTPQQIVVRVQMVEVNLTHMRNLGFDFHHLDPLSFRGYSGVYAQQDSEGNLTFETSPASDRQTLRYFLSALEKNGIAKTIADPTVVTTSGRSASFIAGGEFPMPAAQGSSSAVEYRRFGTELQVTAVALGNSKVRLDVHPRVSDIDSANTNAGQKAPTMRVQECNTSCEITFGETLRLSGLETKRIVANRSEKGITEKTEDVGLWVFVTAELVEHMAFNRTSVQQPSAVYTPPPISDGKARLGSRPTAAR